MKRRIIDWVLARPHQFLEFVTILYLTVPIMLFFYGWLKALYAALAIGATLACLVWYYRSLYGEQAPKVTAKVVYTKGALIGALLVLLLWVAMSGIGGIGRQNFDYNKHNAVIADLTTKDYPVYYDIEGQHKPLVYYVSYYLPAAVVGKTLGDSVAVTNAALLLLSLIHI